MHASFGFEVGRVETREDVLMKPVLKTLLISVAALLLLTLRSHAQTPADPAQQSPATPSASGTPDAGKPVDRFLTVQQDKQTISDEVIGASVRNRQGEAIGKIVALLFDENDRIIAGVVSVGGFLGIGAKSVAVNWSEFQFQPEKAVVVASLSREQLENAPAFTDRQEQKAKAELEQRLRDQEQQRQSRGTVPSQ